MADSPAKPSWLERVGALLMREPEDRDQLVELLRSAYDRNLLDVYQARSERPTPLGRQK